MNLPMRDYDNAMSRLEALQRYLGEGPVTDRLAGLKITILGGAGTQAPPSEFIDCLAPMIRADLQRYGSRLIQAAQDEVRKAADALKAAIDADLNSNHMRD
jgi:hypothetical protein